jgi:hypothetical protein
MRTLYAFVVDKTEGGNHVMVVSDTGSGVMNIHADSIEDAKEKTGVTSDNLHVLYSKLFPEGWTIRWVDNPEDDDGLIKAIKINNLKMSN